MRHMPSNPIKRPQQVRVAATPPMPSQAVARLPAAAPVAPAPMPARSQAFSKGGKVSGSKQLSCSDSDRDGM